MKKQKSFNLIIYFLVFSLIAPCFSYAVITPIPPSREKFVDPRLVELERKIKEDVTMEKRNKARAGMAKASFNESLDFSIKYTKAIVGQKNIDKLLKKTDGVLNKFVVTKLGKQAIKTGAEHFGPRLFKQFRSGVESDFDHLFHTEQTEKRVAAGLKKYLLELQETGELKFDDKGMLVAEDSLALLKKAKIYEFFQSSSLIGNFSKEDKAFYKNEMRHVLANIIIQGNNNVAINLEKLTELTEGANGDIKKLSRLIKNSLEDNKEALTDLSKKLENMYKEEMGDLKEDITDVLHQINTSVKNGNIKEDQTQKEIQQKFERIQMGIQIVSGVIGQMLPSELQKAFQISQHALNIGMNIAAIASGAVQGTAVGGAAGAVAGSCFAMMNLIFQDKSGPSEYDIISEQLTDLRELVLQF